MANMNMIPLRFFPLVFAVLLSNGAVHAQVTLNSQITLKGPGDGGTKGAGAASAPGASTTAVVEDKVKLLQESVKKATDRLQAAGKSGAEKIKQLENLAESVKSALQEVSPNGGLYTELKKSIDSTDARAKSYHDKSIDPKLSAETQLRYRTLENRFSGVKDKLYKGMMALDAQRVDLEKKLQAVVENKELVADLLAANDLEEANRAVLDVVKNMGSVNESFGDLLNSITSGSIPEKTE
jgi:hypothetical protein